MRISVGPMLLSLPKQGYEVDRVTDQGLSGDPDDELWLRVTAENRFFVTLDLDFSDLRRFPPGSHPGILLIRPRSRSRNSVEEVLRRVLSNQTLESLKTYCYALRAVLAASFVAERRERPPMTLAELLDAASPPDEVEKRIARLVE